MSKENENQRDEKLLNSIPNVLMDLRFIIGRKFSEIHKFFRAPFLKLKENELFDETPYRQKWQNNLNVIHLKFISYFGSTDEEILDAMKIAENVLLENHKKVLYV